MRDFQVAAGTIIGRNHSEPLAAKPNQDAFLHPATEDAIIAIVCDGCSSGTHSEVGAKIGARLIVQAISSYLPRLSGEQPSLNELEAALERVREDVLAQIRVLANTMGGSFTKTVGDYFLFTVIGAIVTPLWTGTFSNGDGVYFVNGEMNTLGPFPGNEPPYFSYAMVQSKFTSQQLMFQVNRLFSTAQLDSLLVGSDGVADLAAVAERNLPGRKEVVGPISQFWEQDRYFENPDNIRRKLALANQLSVRLDRENQRVVREVGLLPDDTTLVVIRQRPMREEVDDASNP